MPSEAQLKAQMQAAIAKKKQEAIKAKSAPVVEVPVKPKPEPVPVPEPAPKAEVKPTKTLVSDVINARPVIDHPSPVTHPVTVTLTFYGRAIRYTIHKQDVYFAVLDMLRLSNFPDFHNRFIEFTNNPKTKDTAESLIKVLTFIGPDGSEKIEGATAPNILAIFREMKLPFPGSMGRWLHETAAHYQPKE